MAPEEIVAELDKHIVGQRDAKRAVAVAIRNRWRRRRLPKQLADEVIPRNILMIGPTGVGKTEVARRVAKLANSPFIKVEATKFTEVGFRGMDVDQIIKDLVEVSLTQTKKREREKLRSKVEQQVEDRLLDLILFGQQARSDSPTKSNMSAVGATDAGTPGVNYKESFRQLLRQGGLDDATVEYDLPPPETGKGQQGILGSVGDLDEQASGGMPFTVLTNKHQVEGLAPHHFG
jgi:ATP-dependent HslUV protease ATP-binding subunit HslU